MAQDIDNFYPDPERGLASPGVSPGKRTAPITDGSPFLNNPDVPNIACPSDANKSGVLGSHHNEMSAIQAAVGRDLPSPGPVPVPDEGALPQRRQL